MKNSPINPGIEFGTTGSSVAYDYADPRQAQAQYVPVESVRMLMDAENALTAEPVKSDLGSSRIYAHALSPDSQTPRKVSQYDFPGPIPDSAKPLVNLQVVDPGWKHRGQTAIRPRVGVLPK